MEISPTRSLVRSFIGYYHELENLLSLGIDLEYIETKAEGLGSQLLNANPYWWEPDWRGMVRQKPELRGSSINQLVQAIRAVNSLLDEEIEGVEEFNP